METLPNRSRYQSFAVKVYVVVVAVAVAAVLVVVGVDNVYDDGETMMADDVDALTAEATEKVVVVVVVVVVV